jgi:hypothetical protein
MDGKYWLAQTYSTQSKRFMGCNENREGCEKAYYDLRGAPLQMPP